MGSLKVLVAAAAAGVIVGGGSIAVTPSGRQAILHSADRAGVALGMRRARLPQPGDHWPGCDDARAAGTAPIYDGEPGYSWRMDGDGDGVACENY